MPNLIPDQYFQLYDKTASLHCYVDSVLNTYLFFGYTQALCTDNSSDSRLTSPTHFVRCGSNIDRKFANTEPRMGVTRQITVLYSKRLNLHYWIVMKNRSRLSAWCHRVLDNFLVRCTAIWRSAIGLFSYLCTNNVGRSVSELCGDKKSYYITLRNQRCVCTSRSLDISGQRLTHSLGRPICFGGNAT